MKGKLGPTRRLPEALEALSVYDFGEQVEKQVRFTSTGVERPFLQRNLAWHACARVSSWVTGTPHRSSGGGGVSNRGCSPSRDGPGLGAGSAVRPLYVSGGKAQGRRAARPEGLPGLSSAMEGRLRG